MLSEKTDLIELGQQTIKASEEMVARHKQYYTEIAERATEKADDTAFYDALQEEVVGLKKAAVDFRTAAKTIEAATDELETRMQEVRRSEKKRRVIPAAPANAIIDFREERSNHFARGTNFYKMALMCFIGSFAGVIVEMLWCLVRNGYIESRAGLVYGPFNLLYGIGAMAITLALYRFRNRSWFFSFLGGAIVGSVVEYICSWAQELVLGSTSWDYSGMPFNLNGRICLLYSIFWGVLGVFWVKSLYPRVSKWILKIPNRYGRAITWLLVAFLVFNCAMSLLAANRWSERLHGEQASNGFELWLDKRFPDTRMEKIYANMEFGNAE